MRRDKPAGLGGWPGAVVVGGGSRICPQHGQRRVVRVSQGSLSGEGRAPGDLLAPLFSSLQHTRVITV